MSTVSIRLPDEIELSLSREAQRTRRPKSEIARDAIAEYLKRQERDRFLGDIARAARARGDSDALRLAAEALPLDNESMDKVDRISGVREPRV